MLADVRHIVHGKLIFQQQIAPHIVHTVQLKYSN